jgi:dTDP-4-amino-4,6-dideoxygalactose transaminase
MPLQTQPKPAAARDPLALLGGVPAVPDSQQHARLFQWPIVTAEDEQAVIEVLRSGKMSAWDITQQFEVEFARYFGMQLGLGYPNGTMALLAAMYAAGLRRGDELICPTLTYWASALQAFSLGATIVFADVEPDSLCLDPDDIERHIGPRTKAIMAVHYCGHPARMDAIMAVARRHGLKVIEDVSHAQGTLYRGRMVGTFGDVSAMSLMSIKSFAIGEGGMLLTNDRVIYEHALAFSHYERTLGDLTLPELRRVAAADGFATGLPLGAVKGRMNQTCAAMGRVQLKYYPERILTIQRAMNRFWDLLEDVPGIRPHRPAAGSGSTMGGWYNPVGHYDPEVMGQVPVGRFVEALNAEGARSGRGVNFPLHLHPLLNEADIYGDGRPTRIAFSERDVRQPRGSLPVAESVGDRAFGIPSFKQDQPDLIEKYALAYRKVAAQAGALRA